MLIKADDIQYNHTITSTKMKNKKYHTVGTILKYHIVGTILKYHTVGTILKYHTVGIILKYQTVGTIPRSNIKIVEGSKLDAYHT